METCGSEEGELVFDVRVVRFAGVFVGESIGEGGKSWGWLRVATIVAECSGGCLKPGEVASLPRRYVW